MSTNKPLSETNFSKQWWQFELQIIYIFKKLVPMSSSAPFFSSVSKVIKLTIFVYSDFFFSVSAWIFSFVKPQLLAFLRGTFDMIPMPLAYVPSPSVWEQCWGISQQAIKELLPSAVNDLPAWVTLGLYLAWRIVKLIFGALVILLGEKQFSICILAAHVSLRLQVLG